MERAKLLEILKLAGGNVVVYSGDTHAAYAGMLTAEDGSYVGAEYSSPGTTSPSSEQGATLPLQLLNAAALAAHNVRLSYTSDITSQCMQHVVLMTAFGFVLQIFQGGEHAWRWMCSKPLLPVNLAVPPRQLLWICCPGGCLLGDFRLHIQNGLFAVGCLAA